jgi:hypothetical protein
MSKVGAVHRTVHIERVFSPLIRAIGVNRPYLKIIELALALLSLTSCATIPRHQFVEPTNDWQARSGQLWYRTPKTSLIGDVLVRFSKRGDFELTFSKGPGMTLLILRQDAQFASLQGALARTGWAGPVDRAPRQLRSWLGLREAFLRASDQKSVRHVADHETFLFRF